MMKKYIFKTVKAQKSTILEDERRRWRDAERVIFIFDENPTLQRNDAQQQGIYAIPKFMLENGS